ncbi:MAG: DUF4139 domain-containing protein [Planctomycetales bacterium]|nr:DUF4139 domain-containing protein [Planctomycetales bacterium]
MPAHRAVIYSNGIADFRRGYSVEGTLKVAIPVKQNHVADVLASLHVLGDVRLSSPPTFRPANEAEGALQLEPGNALVGLAQALVGAEVEVHRAAGATRGTLAGVHSHRESNGGAAYEVQSLVVSGPEGLKSLPLAEVQTLRFLDATVQSELDKALQRHVQRIKPHSTFVELELSSDSPAEALVQYTVPAAAWKISYRLRQLQAEQFELQGYAIVDNNTDEDWRDFQLAVVTGDPITFSTDLADSKSPQRRHVNVVQDEAYGAVELQASMVMAELTIDDDVEPTRSGGQRMQKMSRMAAAPRRAAQTPETSIKETGDFCIYEAQTPVSIDSNRSAVIPVFQVSLEQARPVAHFSVENHPTRPFRAIRFINETGHSLGRGVCTVFESDVYGGSCIMPATKPLDEALLPHALETGVLARVEPGRIRTHRIGLRLADGVAHEQIDSQRNTVYRFHSSRDETLELLVDHNAELADPRFEATLQVNDDEPITISTSETLSHGIRLRCDLPARAEAVITIREATTHWTRVVLAGDDGKTNLGWLDTNVIESGGPLSDDESIRACREIQQEIDAKRSEITAAEREADQLGKRQDRLRKNVEAGANAQQASQWLADLAAAEQRLVEIEEQLPVRYNELKEIESRLHAALRKLKLEWSR